MISITITIKYIARSVLLLFQHLQNVLLVDTIAVLGMILEDAHHVQNI